jgi:hypothetical protein
VGADGGGADRCRHCLTLAPGDRTRGLCPKCHANPGVRAMYPVRALRRGDTSHLRTGISEEECAALPPSWGDEELPPPGPYTPGPEEKKVGDWLHAPEVGRHGAFELHPETTPEAIAARQREDVREAVGRLRRKLGREPTAAEVSEEVVLPVWNCEQWMAEGRPA